MMFLKDYYNVIGPADFRLHLTNKIFNRHGICPVNYTNTKCFLFQIIFCKKR